MPITWRNVTGRGNGDAARLLEGAGRSIGRGFDALRGAVAARDKQQTDLYNNEVAANTQDFKDALAGYGSADELAAARDSGELTRLADQFNGRINRDVARTGADDLIATLRNRETAEATRQAQPVLDQIAAARASNNDSLRDQLIGENRDLLIQANQLGNTAERNTNQDRKEIVQSREDTLFNEGRALKSNKDKFAQIRSEEISKGGTEADIRARIIERSGDLDQSYVIEQGIPSIAEAVQGHYGTTGEQEAQLQSVAATAASLAQREITASETQLERIRTDNPINPTLSYTDADRVPLSAATKLAAEYGYDKEVLGEGSLGQQINNVIDSVAKTRTNIKKDPNLGAIVKEAVARLGEDDDFFDNGNLPKADLNRLITQVYDEYLASEKNRKIVRDAEDNHAALTNSVNDNVLNTVSKARANFKKLNRTPISQRGQ